MQQTQPILLRYSDSSPTSGEVQTRSLTKQNRLMACIKIWALLWVAAVLAVFLPILHFFAVPALLIAGPVIGLYKYGQRDLILGGKGICPSCKQELKIEKGTLRWPLEELCTSCRRIIQINMSG